MKCTMALAGLNCVVFAVYAAPYVGDAAGFLWFAKGDVIAGVPVGLDALWPGIISYMFGHAGLTHLGVNMMMLALAGPALEGRAGPHVFYLYVVGGVAGAISHMTVTGMAGIDSTLIGASAAVSGIFGASVIYRTMSVRSAAYFVVVLNVFPLAGIAAGIIPYDGVSYVAHLGGAVAGAAVAALVKCVACRRVAAPYVDREWLDDMNGAFHRIR